MPIPMPSSDGRYDDDGSGGGGACASLFLLIIIGIVVLVVLASLARARQRSSFQDWTAGHPPPFANAPRRAPLRARLEELRASDPNFSVILFEDFVYALIAQIHAARAGQLERYSPYLAPDVRARLGSIGRVDEVRDIVIAGLRYEDVSGLEPAAPQTAVTLDIECNYTERSPGGSAQSYYAHEQWTLARARSARSRAPDRVKVFACPNCGAPLEQVVGGACGYCRQRVDTGAFDWVVTRWQGLEREAREPMLTGTTEEQGTDFPTVIDPQLGARLAALSARDPQFSLQGLFHRVGLIFQQFQRAWTARDLATMRPFLSDNLFQTQAFWVESYTRQGLRNVTENNQITHLEAARATTDAFYDAITLRVHAAGPDFTVRDSDNQVVGGDPRRVRRYTEYWTLIRAVARSGPARTDAACPNCGAALRVNMAGHCEYCRAKVSSGEFDWVLSRIEQDDAYEG